MNMNAKNYLTGHLTMYFNAHGATICSRIHQAVRHLDPTAESESVQANAYAILQCQDMLILNNSRFVALADAQLFHFRAKCLSALNRTKQFGR